MNKVIVWMRRDLRWEDHAALALATQQGKEVYPIFIFDINILNKLKDKADRRVTYIYNTLQALKAKHYIHIFYGDPIELIPEIAKKFEVDTVLTHEDYESYAIKRDQSVGKKLKDHGIEFKTLKDTVVFDYRDIKNNQNEPYKVFTPYKKRWLYQLEITPEAYQEKKVQTSKLKQNLKLSKIEIKDLEQIGFESNVTHLYTVDAKKIFKEFYKKIDQYKKDRDFPSINGTSLLSTALRFGTISVRSLLRACMPFNTEGKQTWVSELIWREFYFSVLGNFPHVENNAFLTYFSDIKWENDKKNFKAWCEGKTGVPIVDAGMRQLNQTGWMHNRVRMIVASYLCKTLLIDWKWGEKYFAEKLIDFDLSANNGGWQWSASTGCDAAPYFRIFNPYSQSEKFDCNGEYIKKYIPELSRIPAKKIHDLSLLNPMEQMEFNCRIGTDYPAAIADYKANRIKALGIYKKAKG